MATSPSSDCPPLASSSGEVRHFDADDPHEDAVWKSSYISKLPDTAFLYIEPGGTKDEHGRTDAAHRHFPYRDDTGAVDLVHVRDAIGRIPQSNCPPAVKARIQEKARQILANSKTHNDAFHFDASKMRRTPQGGLRGPARPTKVGVFKYRHADGRLIAEYRPAEEVFAPDSLATLDQAPITDFHPPESSFVNPENFAALAKGQVTNPHEDGRHVEVDAIIQDAAVVREVLSGGRVDMSCGYVCDYDWTPGVFDGQPYDVVQRNIRYNHVALLPPGGGRQGKDVALRFDAAMIEIMIHFDGKDYDLTTEDGRKAYDLARQAKLEAANAARDVAQAKADAVEAELAPLKAAKIAEARKALETQARKLVKDAKFDGLTDRQVRETTLSAVKVDCTGKSDEYVVARFDAALEAPAPAAPDPELEAARLAMSPPATNLGAQTNVPASWNDAWKKPLTASKDKK